jgi:hypothetical protein
MNWYKKSQYEHITPQPDDDMSYIATGHGYAEPNTNWLWWSTDGRSINTEETTGSKTHWDIKNIKHSGIWKGRFSKLNNTLTIATPFTLRTYYGVPSSILNSLKNKFNPSKIKVYISSASTHIRDYL